MSQPLVPPLELEELLEDELELDDELLDDELELDDELDDELLDDELELDDELLLDVELPSPGL